MGRHDNDRVPRVRRVAALGLVALAVLGTAGCSTERLEQWQRFGLPEPATDRATHVVSLWQGSWIAALALGVLVWGLIVWAVVAYRKRDDTIPAQTRYHVPIEVLYTVVPFIIVSVLFYFTVRDQNAILAVSDPAVRQGDRVATVESGDAPDVQIHVVGQQWSWTFNHLPQEEGGTTVHEIGTPAELPPLYLPVGEKVGITLTSPDVVHSFFVPAFLFKMDVFPGRDNYFEFTPTREGEFAGKCAELCGQKHARMLFTVHVVSPQEYDAYLADLAERGQTGLVLGGDASKTQQGLEQESETS